MGCDIHAHIEVRINGTWHHYSAPRLTRWYQMFTKICGVRRYDDREAIKQLIPKERVGLDYIPSDLSSPTQMDLNEWDGDAHSHVCLSGSELTELYHWYLSTIETKRQEGADKYEARDFFTGHPYWDEQFFNWEKDCFTDDVRMICWFDN